MTRPTDDLADLCRPIRCIRNRVARVGAVSLRTTLARLPVITPLRLIFGHRNRITDGREPLARQSRIAVHHPPRAGHMPQSKAVRDLAAILARNTALSSPPLFPAQKET